MTYLDKAAWLQLAAAALMIVGFSIIGAHTHMPKERDSLRIERNVRNEVGIYCDNGHDPVIIGMEEKYLIIACK